MIPLTLPHGERDTFNPTDIHVTLDQVIEIIEATQNDLKKEIWKARKELLAFAHEMKKEIGEVKVHDRESRGNLQINVGEVKDPSLEL